MYCYGITGPTEAELVEQVMGTSFGEVSSRLRNLGNIGSFA